jgi:hypothetical protein
MSTNALAIILLSALVADPEPCKLLTAAEISSALGTVPAEGRAAGPVVDKDYEAKNWSCDRTVGKFFLSLDVFEFSSTAAAAQGLAKVRELSKDGDPFPMQPVAGERDQSLWGSSEEGAIWAVARGKYIVTLTLAGDLDNPSALRDPLKRLVGAAVGRL